MSDAPDLSPDDVKEILRLVDESQFDEFELETPRFSIRVRRAEADPAARIAVADTNGLVEITAPMVGRSTGPLRRTRRRSSRSAHGSRNRRRCASSR
jgi:Biotin carboxyl carrier protein